MTLPISILEKKYQSYLKADRKSLEAWVCGRIDWETRVTHINNINEKLKQFENALNLLKQ